MTLQPYQEASEEIVSQSKAPFKAAANIASIGGSVIGGGKILNQAINRVLPFLNQFIPSNLAAKGLAKIDPRFGQFIKNAMSQGHTEDDILSFLREKTGATEQNQQPAQNQRNIIEQYSPELHQFLQGHIQQGRAPIEAGALAQLDPKFKKVINQLEKDHRTNFSSILSSVFGQSQNAQQESQTSSQTIQGAQGDQALLAALDKILKM